MRSRNVLSPIRFASLFVVLAVTLTACTVTTSSTTQPNTPPSTGNKPGNASQVVLASNALVVFDACDTFLDYVISHAVDMVGPYGLDDPSIYPWFGGALRAPDEAAVVTEFATGDGSVPNFSNTNVQVIGVDEPDIVKTDGRRIVILSEGNLIIADVTGDEPEVTGRLNVGNHSIQSMFLSGDRVLMFGSQWSTFRPLVESDAEFAPVYQTPTIQIIEVDISDDPEIVRTMTIDGRFLSGRMVGDSVRLVITSGPVGFEWAHPSGSGLRAERKAVEENREIIRNSEPDNWIPYYVVTDADGDVTNEGILFDCERASHPEEFSGLNMLSVLTIDLGDGLDLVDSTGVLANGDTIYASPDSLYVATQNWQTWQWARSRIEDDEPDGITTDIHKFDISNTETTTYIASGVIDGYLLNQFAMDEYEGMLRVASTTSPSWWGSGFESESMVTVLRDIGGVLVEIGQVDGLGKTEQIYSVRFMGDVAYVVTFRQTDPLYTVDLSDPRHPTVAGELKILGYSAYLHPLGNGLLMGVGQDATDTGRVRGTQVSIFDVSDISNPVRVHQHTLAKGSNSAVEYDHHAFLYWDETGLAMIPVQQYSRDDESESAWFGAVALRVENDGGLKEVSRVAHPGGDEKSWDWRAQIQRSIVIGDSVYTLSSKGIMKSSLDTLTEEAWLDF
ncbi:MAG: beta-propeller domain-containing protein [Acidimicrobiia bacterium]